MKAEENKALLPGSLWPVREQADAHVQGTMAYAQVRWSLSLAQRRPGWECCEFSGPETYVWHVPQRTVTCCFPIAKQGLAVRSGVQS